MILGITYTSGNMNVSADKCVNSMLDNQFDICKTYRRPDIDDLIKMNPEIYQEGARGADCYWLFKPYIIYKAFSMCEDGDILIYSDAGVEFVNNVSHIINRMDQDIFFFSNGWPHYDWCKRDVFISILIDDIWEQKAMVRADMPQVQASVIFFKVNANTRKFVKEWLLWCQMPGFIDDSPSEGPEYPCFQEHRHDQAILTCLAYKYGYKLHFWPTQYSNHLPRTSEDNYPVLFNHHRKRDNEY